MNRTCRLVTMVGLAASLLTQPAAAQVDWTRHETHAVELLREYLRIDTSNPPGNERRAADFFCALFRREGIECQVFEIAPGRANAYARLRGNGSKRPLILLNHTDVVIADPKGWSAPPFSGELRGGVVYGRGAEDMKAEGMLQAMVMVALKREGVSLARDVIFSAVADEEVNTLGTLWMLQHQRPLVNGAEFLINEGGENVIENGVVPLWGVDVSEKIPLWLRVVARGKAGHASVPLADAAPRRLVRALARAVDYETPLKVLPLAQRALCDEARVRSPQETDKFCHLEAALADPAFRKRLTQNPDWNYLLRNTISLTVLRGGPQTNVIPAEAVAELDVRLLPGEDPQKFLADIRRVIADDAIEVEPITPFRLANASPLDNDAWHVFEEVVRKHFPGTTVSPRLTSGYTESQIYRELGIASYGFCPFVTTREESDTAHGTDERVSVDAYRKGLHVLYDVVIGLAGRASPR